MATLVLTTVGAIVGGPIGATIGAIAGNSIDQMLFAPKGRTGPRLDDLTVQSSAYGLPHPRLYGTTRAAGNVIWSRGLRETAHRSGGGKRSGGRTTTYSYSASFAVAISARPIVGIGRIWADGKLLRGAAGEMTAEGAVRIYTGGEPAEGMLCWIADEAIVAVFGGGVWNAALPVAGLNIGGVMMLTEPLVAIDAPEGGSVIDIEARAALTSLLGYLREQGLLTS